MFDDESKLKLTNDVNLILNLRFSPIQQSIEANVYIFTSDDNDNNTTTKKIWLIRRTELTC